MTEKHPRVLLLIDRAREYGRGLVRGIAKYSRLNGPWTFYLHQDFTIKTYDAEDLNNITLKDADGIIMYDFPGASDVLKLHLPTILAISVGKCRYKNVPFISSDPSEVGKKAAQHLLDRGFRNYAYCGLPKLQWSIQRGKGFITEIENAGFKAINHTEPGIKDKKISRGSLYQWLESLPKPIGIMACNDDLGRRIIDACGTVKIKVPEDIAVIGVDNDEMVCDLSNPPLSSIALNTEKAGYEAARLLEMMMAGKKPDVLHIPVPVLETVERASTDIQAINDKEVVAAIRFIRKSFNKPIQVADVAAHVATNRRTLERKFRKYVGNSVNNQIRKVRVRHIAQMLVETNMSISDIVFKLGYVSVDHVSRYFKSETGLSLMEYRKKNSRP